MTSLQARPAPVTRFTLPPGAAATNPPEARGLARDEVRLMVSSPLGIAHTRFRELAGHLEPGDLIVVNTSATLPAAVRGQRDSGPAVVVHFSGPADAGRWLVELRDAGVHRIGDGRVGERIELPHGVTLTLTSAWPDPTRTVGSRMWLAGVAVESELATYLEREARPITYDHIDGHWPLAAFQTIFARHPGSAEMVSAARPFSERVLADLRSRGVGMASLILHTGVSSLEADELPLPERYDVPAATAERVNATRARGGRVVAAGTTVTRALETVTGEDGVTRPDSGVTDLVIGPEHLPRAVNGLLTGWHEPAASHLLMLEAVAGAELVGLTYAAALDPPDGRYLWHEFGDSCLLLP